MSHVLGFFSLSSCSLISFFFFFFLSVYSVLDTAVSARDTLVNKDNSSSHRILQFGRETKELAGT